MTFEPKRATINYLKMKEVFNCADADVLEVIIWIAE